MKEFSDFEKDIIYQMLGNRVFVNHSEQNNMRKLIDKYVKDKFDKENLFLLYDEKINNDGDISHSLMCKYSEKKLTEKLNSQAPEWYKNESEHCKKYAETELISFRLFIVELTIMLDELQAEKYIYLVPTNNKPSSDVQGEIEETFDCTEKRPFDIGYRLRDKFYQYLGEQIIFSSKLNNLLKYKFKTDEEIRHNEQIKLLKKSNVKMFFVALASLMVVLITSGFSIYLSLQDSIEDKEQEKKTIQSTKEITTAIDKLTKSQYEILSIVNGSPDKSALK